jgi:DNA repair protein RadC
MDCQMNVRLTKEQKIKISNSRDIFKIMQQILMRENKIGRDKEHFWIIGLSMNNRILFIELISLGTVSMSLVHPMEVFSFALQKRAVRLILAHNHLSGELEPSVQDKDITDRLLQNSLFLEVPIIDHVIISETNHYSFAESG